MRTGITSLLNLPAGKAGCSIAKLLIGLFVYLFIGLFLIVSPISASTTLYFGSIEKTYDDSGAVTEEKVYIPAGNSTVVKTTVYGLRSTDYSQQTTDSLSFLHSDHLGSTVLVTDNGGNITDTMVYYSYGNIQSQNQNSNFKTKSDLVKTDKLYTGQRLDSSTNLYYYNARYYNPSTAHFISADKAEGPNRYAYVGNNPVGRNDPSGMMQAEFGGGGSFETNSPLSGLNTDYNLSLNNTSTIGINTVSSNIIINNPPQSVNEMIIFQEEIEKKYNIKLYTEGSRSWSRKEIDILTGTLDTIPKKMYQDLSFYNIPPLKINMADADSLYDAIAVIGAGLIGGQPIYRSYTDIFLADVVFTPLFVIAAGSSSRSGIIHEIAHTYLDNNYDKQERVNVELAGGTALLPKLNAEFIQSRGWNINDNGQWYRKGFNPDPRHTDFNEDFAWLAEEYYSNGRDKFFSNYGEAVTNVFDQMFIP